MAITQQRGTRPVGSATLSEQVRFRMYLKGRDPDGGEIKTWLTSNAIFAGIEYQTSSDEKSQPGRKGAETNVMFTMYFRQAMRQTWRILYRDQEYEILSIMPDAERFLMRLEAVQQEPNLDDYFASPADGYWMDGDGNYFVSTWRGPTTDVKPTFGNLTWEDGDGNTWQIE